MDNLQFLATIPANSVRLIVTSPPYNIGKKYESYEDDMSLRDYVHGQFLVIRECVRKLVPGGSICWQVGNHVSRDGEVLPLDIALHGLFKEAGLKLRNRIVWTYGHGLNCTKRLSGRHETILWFTKGDDYVFNLDPVRVPQKYPGKKHFKGPKAGQLSCNPLGKSPGDVWDIPNVKSNHCEKTDHPCQFPVELAERLVLMLSNPGDVVLDPYMGSGTTAVAAVRNGRDGIGCDVSEAYVETAKKRLVELRNGTLAVRESGDPMPPPGYDPDLEVKR